MAYFIQIRINDMAATVNTPDVNPGHGTCGTAAAPSIAHLDRRFWHRGKFIKPSPKPIWRPARRTPRLTIFYGLAPCLGTTLVGDTKKSLQPTQLLFHWKSLPIRRSVELPTIQEGIYYFFFAILQSFGIYVQSTLLEFLASCLHNLLLGLVVPCQIWSITYGATRKNHHGNAT